MSHRMREIRAFARRAVWAMLQDPVVGFNMVDDLEKRVERAVRVAESTKQPSSAIKMAGDLAEMEERSRLNEIEKCEACKAARERVGYPGMPASARYCEEHQ